VAPIATMSHGAAIRLSRPGTISRKSGGLSFELCVRDADRQVGRASRYGLSRSFRDNLEEHPAISPEPQRALGVSVDVAFLH